MIVKLTLATVDDREETDLIRDVEVETTTNGGIVVESVIKQLKQFGYKLGSAAISYYSIREEAYIFCGTDPLSQAVTIHPTELSQDQLLLRTILAPTQTESPAESQGSREERKTRGKERRIKEVIDYVQQWRRLYNGYSDGNGEMSKLSLEQAADRVGLSKKSLDDYFLQIKLGHKHEFDFESHKHEPIGVLRRHVREKKQELSAEFPSAS